MTNDRNFSDSDSWLTLILIAVTTFTITFCNTSKKTENSGSSPNRLIGYVHGNQKVTVEPSDAKMLTHINYAFANLTADSNVILEQKYDSTNLARLRSLKKHNPDLKILLSIGGWAWSDYFSDAALTEESRTKFARSAIKLMTEHQLDGLDIDWEYPGQPGQDNIYRPEDRENFTLLLKTVREHLDEQSAENLSGDPYLLTIAAGTNDQYLDHTDMETAQRYLDFVNLMTYDFHGSWTNHTGHHANLYSPSDIDNMHDELSADASVKRFMDAGLPSHKIVLGVPFYGRGWSGVDRSDNGLYQAYSEPLEGFSYDSLDNHLIDQNGFSRHWDDLTKTPYLWHPDSSIFITYEDEQSLKFKVDYVREQNLGGLMYWNHNQDPHRKLLNAIHSYLQS